MYIEPNTEIRILRNCPLDTTYEHTIYFANEPSQSAYFKGLTKHTLTKQTYQRVKRGYMRVAKAAESLYDCNYLMFQNTAFGSKWFYAFIKSVEYVNNVTSEIEFEIDVMQTWYFDYQLQECFVEREHSATDKIGDNIVQENLNIGEYVYGDSTTFEDEQGYTMDNLSVVIMYNPGLFDPLDLVANIDSFRYNENFYSGVYQGVKFIAIPAIRENASIIEPLISSTDFLSSGGFLSAFIMPTMFLPNRAPTMWDGVEYNKQVPMYVTRPTDFNGYYPNNNKLFTYPYTCAYLTSSRGKGNDFAFEYFVEDGKALFYAEGNMCANPSVMAYPWGYKGVPNYLEGAVSIDGYPVCTWGADGVTEWINNNLFKSLITTGASIVSAGVAPTPSNVSSAVNHTVATAIGGVRSIADNGTVHGGVTGDVLIGNLYGREIRGMVKSITKSYAMIIDDYFTKFGYATNRLKVPNTCVRPQWTYTKTISCAIKGSIPCDDAKKICGIYDKGITFWKYGANVGDYTLSNAV